MLADVFELLTGTGLAASAGLNAYIPLLSLALLARFTDLVDLPASWQWLENPWVLGILAVLLTVEFVADKIPAVDHVNDVLQTVVRPTSGGLVFGASSGATTATVADPEQFFTSHQWVPVVMGITISLCVHAVKAATRAGVNMMTIGFGAPIMSTLEDLFSVGMSLVAILLPVLVVGFLIVLIAVFWWALRRRRLRKQRKLAARYT
jgi:hypothetical protein